MADHITRRLDSIAKAYGTIAQAASAPLEEMQAMALAEDLARRRAISVPHEVSLWHEYALPSAANRLGIRTGIGLRIYDHGMHLPSLRESLEERCPDDLHFIEKEFGGFRERLASAGEGTVHSYDYALIPHAFSRRDGRVERMFAGLVEGRLAREYPAQQGKVLAGICFEEPAAFAVERHIFDRLRREGPHGDISRLVDRSAAEGYLLAKRAYLQSSNHDATATAMPTR